MARPLSESRARRATSPIDSPAIGELEACLKSRNRYVPNEASVLDDVGADGDPTEGPDCEV